jgi:hypothetical protein
LVRGRAQHLPFADASFDTVLSTFPAEFAFARQTLSEVARVMAPRGSAVFLVMAQFVPDTLWEWILEWLYRITGQRAPLPPLDAHLEALGLECRTLWQRVGRTKVLLAVLERGASLRNGKPGGRSDRGARSAECCRSSIPGPCR